MTHPGLKELNRSIAYAAEVASIGTTRDETPDWCAGCDRVVERCYMRWDFGAYRCLECLGGAVIPVINPARPKWVDSGCDEWAN